MIKYKVIGNFQSANDIVQEVSSEMFINVDKPISARKLATKYFNNFIEMLLEDFEINFNDAFVKTSEIIIENKAFLYTEELGIKLICYIDDEENIINFFGNYQNPTVDSIVLGLQEEYEYYITNNLDDGGFIKTITYCNLGEWTEGYHEDEPSTFNILETSFDFTNKNQPYWWRDENDKVELINQFLANDKLEENIFEGESNQIEYKSALIYNFKTNAGGIGVKYIVAKAICGFLNSNGGILYIGISDKKDVIGLEHDFSLSNKKDPHDFFRLEFDNLLYQFFDKTVLNYLKSEFISIDDKIIFSIKILPSDIPFFLFNKNESKKEFWIRGTASTLLINDIEEILKYCLTHWKRT